MPNDTDATPTGNGHSDDDLRWLEGEPDEYVAQVLDLADNAEWLGDGAFDDHRVGECAQCDAIRVRRDRRAD